MAKTVFGIPGADAKQQQGGGAVAPKGVSGVSAPNKAMPQKAGGVGTQRPVPARGAAPAPKEPAPQSPPAKTPPKAVPAAKAPPKAAMATKARRAAPAAPATPAAPPTPAAEPAKELDMNAPVDVQGKTVFGMPAMKIPMQEPAPQPGVPAKVYDTQPAPSPIEDGDQAFKETVAIGADDDQPTTEVKAATPEQLGEETPSATVQVSSPEESSYAPNESKSWLWVLVVIGALAIAGGGALLVMQMLEKGGISDADSLELESPQ